MSTHSVSAPTACLGRRPPSAAACDLLRCGVWLLAACLVMQAMAVTARRAMGPGHYHLRLAMASGAMTVPQAEALPHHHDDSSLPFDGRLRTHAAPAFHGEVEFHRHRAETRGVVTVVDDGSAPGIAAWAAMLRSALDLPALLVVPVLRAMLPVRGIWSSRAPAAFASRSTAPPLRPPRR